MPTIAQYHTTVGITTVGVITIGIVTVGVTAVGVITVGMITGGMMLLSPYPAPVRRSSEKLVDGSPRSATR